MWAIWSDSGCFIESCCYCILCSTEMRNTRPPTTKKIVLHDWICGWCARNLSSIHRLETAPVPPLSRLSAFISCTRTCYNIIIIIFYITFSVLANGTERRKKEDSKRLTESFTGLSVGFACKRFIWRARIAFASDLLMPPAHVSSAYKHTHTHTFASDDSTVYSLLSPPSLLLLLLLFAETICCFSL